MCVDVAAAGMGTPRVRPGWAGAERSPRAWACCTERVSEKSFRWINLFIRMHVAYLRDDQGYCPWPRSMRTMHVNRVLAGKPYVAPLVSLQYLSHISYTHVKHRLELPEKDFVGPSVLRSSPHLPGIEAHPKPSLNSKTDSLLGRGGGRFATGSPQWSAPAARSTRICSLGPAFLRRTPGRGIARR